MSNNPNPYINTHTHKRKGMLSSVKTKLGGINIVLSCQAFRLGISTNCLLINVMMSYDTSMHDDSSGSIIRQEINIENDGMWYYCQLNLVPILFPNMKA